MHKFTRKAWIKALFIWHFNSHASGVKYCSQRRMVSGKRFSFHLPYSDLFLNFWFKITSKTEIFLNESSFHRKNKHIFYFPVSLELFVYFRRHLQKNERIYYNNNEKYKSVKRINFPEMDFTAYSLQREHPPAWKLTIFSRWFY